MAIQELNRIFNTNLLNTEYSGNYNQSTGHTVYETTVADHRRWRSFNSRCFVLSQGWRCTRV